MIMITHARPGRSLLGEILNQRADDLQGYFAGESPPVSLN